MTETFTPIDELNSLLCRTDVCAHPPLLFLLTGSSGSGKSYLCEALATELNSAHAAIYHFDRKGVPSLDEMIESHGSSEKWQEARTHEWITELAAISDKALLIFEGQFHPKFAIDACKRAGVRDFTVAVVTCDQTVWEQRLIGPRGQPELVNDDMRNWALLLRQWTLELGGLLIDTSNSDADESVNDVAKIIIPILQRRLKGH